MAATCPYPLGASLVMTLVQGNTFLVMTVQTAG